MNDQAESLRLRLQQMDRQTITKTLAVVSGKGGVGKSNFSLNFSLSLTKQGYTVLLFDMDIGMGNLDILMGTSSKLTIANFFQGECTLEEAIYDGPGGLQYIAGGSGLNHLVHLSDDMVHEFDAQLSQVMEKYDYILFDMGAGVNEQSLKFILSVDEVVVITTPEPTSITDAYAMMKHLILHNKNLPISIVVNRVTSNKEGMDTYRRLAEVLNRFLEKETSVLGMIPEDRNVRQAVIHQSPVVQYNPNAPAARAFSEMADRINTKRTQEIPTSTVSQFAKRLKQFLFER
ncbi:MinD/ParA family protein [Cytobacillus spongiae]|uniref:MinD/ParA family protein n=1 Tax=Cytobacillus spongiae TaxID=2901381 RepID=UPI001F30FC05|nr:MinD/ParA family protein [Cytobacillus spongiae]UII57429.1 MinD/ParA family protein [Cytobacillus spongiae]